MGDRLRFRENVYVNGVYSVGSKMENEGPIGPLLSAAVDNDMFGEKTFEQAERKFFITAAKGAANDAGVDEKEVDLLVGGDLLAAEDGTATTRHFERTQLDMCSSGNAGQPFNASGLLPVVRTEQGGWVLMS